jgi:hypothetical protein
MGRKVMRNEHRGHVSNIIYREMRIKENGSMLKNGVERHFPV